MALAGLGEITSCSVHFEREKSTEKWKIILAVIYENKCRVKNLGSRAFGGPWWSRGDTIFRFDSQTADKHRHVRARLCSQNSAFSQATFKRPLNTNLRGRTAAGNKIFYSIKAL